MGKVLKKFTNGFTGAVSRSNDTIIISVKNASGAAIPFGSPVFLKSGENACRLFESATSTEANFLGFAARAAVKAPDVYGSSEASYAADDPVDVIVRGSVILQFGGSVNPGSSVYIRKADGVLVTDAGAEGTTLRLPNVTVRTVSDGGSRAEAVITKRNII